LSLLLLQDRESNITTQIDASLSCHGLYPHLCSLYFSTVMGKLRLDFEYYSNYIFELRIVNYIIGFDNYSLAMSC